MVPQREAANGATYLLDSPMHARIDVKKAVVCPECGLAEHNMVDDVIAVGKAFEYGPPDSSSPTVSTD